MSDKADWSVRFNVTKVDVEKRHVYGFLSVIEDAQGRLVVDKQGDYILPEDLEKTAKHFMLDSKGAAGEMHQRLGVGQVFESMLFTRDKMAAIESACDLPAGHLTKNLPVAWWIGAEVTAGDAAWDRVKSGERAAWSLGGTGRRI